MPPHWSIFDEKYLKTLKKEIAIIKALICFVIVHFIRRDQKQSPAVCL